MKKLTLLVLALSLSPVLSFGKTLKISVSVAKGDGAIRSAKCTVLQRNTDKELKDEKLLTEVKKFEITDEKPVFTSDISFSDDKNNTPVDKNTFIKIQAEESVKGAPELYAEEIFSPEACEYKDSAKKEKADCELVAPALHVSKEKTDAVVALTIYRKGNISAAHLKSVTRKEAADYLKAITLKGTVNESKDGYEAYFTYSTIVLGKDAQNLRLPMVPGEYKIVRTSKSGDESSDIKLVWGDYKSL